MPVELLMRPVMRPLILAKSILLSPHRRSSRYIPHYIDLDESKCSEYAYRKRFGTGSKIWDVYDTKAENSSPMGPTSQKDSIFWFSRSRAVKGAYKMYSNQIRSTGPNNEDEPVATCRAGLRANVLLIRSPNAPAAELGWHTINHKVDALDSYRMFQLSDGNIFQWTTEGKFLERVKNVGEKESEVRERVGRVVPVGNFGFNLIVDETKIPREIALCSALCSWVDQWNTNLALGGIYYARDAFHVRWKRD
mgnify:FL=1